MDFLFDTGSVELFKGVLGEAFSWQVTQTTISFIIAMWLAKKNAKKGLDDFFKKAETSLNNLVSTTVKTHFDAVEKSLKGIVKELREVKECVEGVGRERKEDHRRLLDLEEIVNSMKQKIKDWEGQSH